MTIKAIKEKYKDYKINGNEKNIFTTYDYKDGNGKNGNIGLNIN